MDALQALLQRRLNGEPMAYLIGTREFWSLPLQVAPGVLVPRPDTETLVDKTLELILTAPPGCIVELGTGSGAIALALAQEVSDRTILAVERDPQALSIARVNVERFGRGRVQLVQGNWLEAIGKQRAAMIISNPPYLADDDVHLPTLTHEPYNALVSGPSGLEDLDSIIRAAKRVGMPGATVVLEHGYEQAASVRSLMHLHRYDSIGSDRDLANHERITYGTLPNTMSI